MLSHSIQDILVFLQYGALCEPMLDIAFRLRVFFRLSFCASFNTIFTAHHIILADILRS